MREPSGVAKKNCSDKSHHLLSFKPIIAKGSKVKKSLAAASIGEKFDNYSCSLEAIPEVFDLAWPN